MNQTLLRSFLVFTTVAVSIYILLILNDSGMLSLTTTTHSHHHDHIYHTVKGAWSSQRFLQDQLRSRDEGKQTGSGETKPRSNHQQQKLLSERKSKDRKDSDDDVNLIRKLASKSNQTATHGETLLNVKVSKKNSKDVNKNVTAEKAGDVQTTSVDLKESEASKRNQNSTLRGHVDWDTHPKDVKKTNITKNQSQASNLARFVGVKNATLSSQKYLIFVCDEKRRCGGWGDRQRGLIGMYALALVTHRKFGVIMTEPCNVTYFYTPNEVNWVIPKNDLKGKSSITINDMGSKQGITAALITLDFNQKYPQDVVYIRTNAEYWRAVRKNKLYAHTLPDWARHSRALYFRTAWRTLMKPSLSLQTKLQAFLDRIDFTHRRLPLVGAHVRAGRTSTISTDTTVRCKISDLPVLWNFVDRWVQNGSHVFLATDSMQVRNLTRNRFRDRMYDSGGQIIHVDQQSDVPDACEGFESALLDQLILTKCDVLITSHSIFSQRASYLRGKSENLYSFMHGKITKHRLP